MKPLSEKQLWTLGSLAVLSPLLRLAPGLPAAAAENAAWLCPLAAIPGLLAYGALLRAALLRRRGGETLPDALRPWAVWLCAAWFGLYGGFLLRMSAERFFAALGVFTRWEPFALALLIMAACAAARGYKPLGRASQLFLPAVTAILLLVAACAAPEMDFGRLGCVSVRDALPVLAGAAPILPVGWGTLLLLALLAPPGAGTDRRRALGFSARLGLTAAALTAVAVGVLGWALTAHLSHPFFILLRNIRLSRALERVEALVTAVWVLPDFVMLSALLALVCRLPRRDRPLSPLLAGGAMLLLAAAISPTAFGLRLWSERIIPISGAAVAWLVPIGIRKQSGE